MSASTDQKVRELADRIYDGMFNAHMNPGRLCYDRDDVATLITQAIAVETAVLREALSYVVDGPTDEERRLFRLDAEDPCNNALNWGEWHQHKQGQARAILSAADSPGAKAEGTASAEFLKKALEQLVSFCEHRWDIPPAEILDDVSDWHQEELYTFLKERG